jgi:hypothetical protein
MFHRGVMDKNRRAHGELGRGRLLAFLAASLLGLAGSTFAADATARLCGQFRQMLRAPSNERPPELQLVPPQDYGALDIDGDGVSDQVDGSCPGDIDTPGDPCLLTYSPSSGREQVEFSFRYGDAFSLWRYRSKVYAVAWANLRHTTDRSLKVYRLRKRGVHLVCSKL